MVLIKVLTNEDFRKFDILYRNRVIYNMVLEDLEIWNEFDRIYPSYLRFPECVEWNSRNHTLNRKKVKQDMEKVIKSINVNIRGILGITNVHSSIAFEFIEKRKLFLEKHLKALREMRDKRYKEEMTKINGGRNENT